MYLPCFSSEARLKHYLTIGGVEWDSVLALEDATHFVSRVYDANPRVKIIYNLLVTLDGEIQFQEVLPRTLH